MKTSQRKKIAFNAFKIGLGLFLLYLSFRRVDWPVFLEYLESVSVFWLLLAILSIFVSLGLKVYRWKIMLAFYQIKLPLLRLIAAFFLGQAANTLFIVRGGEVVRLATAHQPKQDDWLEITSTIVLEKYLDLIFLVFLMMGISTNLPPIALEKLGNLQPVVVMITILLVVLVLFGPILWLRYSTRFHFSGWLHKAQSKLDQFVRASLWLRDLSKLLPSLLVSLLIWLVMMLTNKLVFQSLSLSLGWDAAILVLVLIYIGVLPALMPGNVGPFTYFAQLALIPYAVSNDVALAFAVILYVIVTLPPLFISGVIMLLPAKLGLRINHE